MGRKEVTQNQFFETIEYYSFEWYISKGCIFVGNDLIAKVENNKYYIYEI